MHDWPRGLARWWPLAAALLTSLLFFQHVVSLPADEMLTFVADDTFYYLVLARNLAHSGHLTFDGINSASGVHPAWLSLLTLLSAGGLDGLSLLRAALGAAFACHLLTTFLIVRIVRRAGAPAQAPWIGALWLANPVALALVVEGMEAAMVVTALAACCLAMQTRLARPDGPARQLWIISALLAALCLARTDGLIVAAAAALTIGASAWRAAARGTRPARDAAIIAALPMLAVALFAWWLDTQTGYVTQSSGELKRMWGSIATVHDRLWFLAGTFASLTFGSFGNVMLGVPLRVSWIGGAIFVAGLGLAALRRWFRREAVLPGLSLWLLASSIVTTAAYAIVLYEYRAWYLGLPAFALLMAMALEAAPRRAGRVLFVTAAVLLAAMIRQDVRLAQKGRYRSEPAFFAAIPVFDQLVPEGELIGAFDAGVFGFFSSHRVVNLDGMVNDSVRPFWKARQFDRYFDHAGIRFVAGVGGNFEFMRQFTSLPAMEPVRCFPPPDQLTPAVCLWRLTD